MKKYIWIGAGVVALGVVGYMIFRSMPKKTSIAQPQTGGTTTPKPLTAQQIKDKQQQIKEAQAKGDQQTAAKLADDLVKNKFNR